MSNIFSNLCCIEQRLVYAGISCKVDDTNVTMGRRYARTDECGIPFAITVDQVTLTDQSVTVRYIDTMDQIRLPFEEVPALINNLSLGNTTWQEAVERWGLVDTSSAAKE